MVRECKIFGFMVCDKYICLLWDGYNFYDNIIFVKFIIDFESYIDIVENVIRIVLEDKKVIWVKSIYQSCVYRVLEFIDFVQFYRFLDMLSDEFKCVYVNEFLKIIKESG